MTMPHHYQLGARGITWLKRQRYWFASFGGVLLVAQLLVLIINFSLSDRPILGLRLHHHDVTWQSQNELNDTIDQIVRNIETKPIVIHAANYSGHVSPRQLGTTYNRVLLKQQVLRVGRSDSFWHRAYVQDAALLGRQNVNIGFSRTNKVLVSKYLASLNLQIQKSAQNARFTYLNGELSIAPHIVGLELNTNAALAALQNISDSGQMQTLPTVRPMPKLTTNDLQPLLPEVKKLTSTPLVITATDKQVTVPPERIADLIQPIKQPDPQRPAKQQVVISYNDTKLSQEIDRLAEKVTTRPKPTVVSGKQVVSQGTPGVHVDGTHAKVEVIAGLEKRGQATNTAPTSTDPIVIPTESIDSPVINQVAQDANPLGRYPATVGIKKMVYLTFDDGPGGYTDNILDTLKRYNVHSVFFVVGKNVTIYPQTAKRIISEGHTIANHSYTHSDLGTLKDAAIISELTKTQTAIQVATGTLPDLFRPPYGSINANVRKIVADNGMNVMMWTIDPRDWSKPGSDVITQRVLDGVRPGSNVLLHSIHLQTAQALPAIIEGIRAKGYTLP